MATAGKNPVNIPTTMNTCAQLTPLYENHILCGKEHVSILPLCLSFLKVASHLQGKTQMKTLWKQ
jgi:hypothetical protein